MKPLARRMLAATCLVMAVAPATAAARPAADVPKRIVALTPFGANTLASLGVKAVGVGEILGGTERFSPLLRGVPRLPLSHPNGPNLEQLATLNPDLVLSTAAWRRGTAGIRRLDIDVTEVNPQRVASVPAETRRIGKIVGRTRKARKVAKRQKRLIDRAKRGVKSRPTVLLILGVGRTPYAFMPSSWGGDVVTQAGGRLLTDGLKASGGYAKISDEVIVVRDPDVIVAVPHGNPDDIRELERYYRDNPAWQSTKAVRNNRVYVATGNSLLQAFTDVHNTIRDVQTKFLRNR